MFNKTIRKNFKYLFVMKIHNISEVVELEGKLHLWLFLDNLLLDC